ncbi:MAG: molybdopterin-guanine dinucleotide biosynthesis protein B [Deltaproteobacteria bacterium]|uniref:Molybdopterin-guanine dinucleotide biosynthesis protein B n=1 Tax=Candidatus Desulfacyla euxinica TaxID=2841693 RepID=A0A8J6T6Z6_9DELT|nr:molybdopterin-guanine dinucleotide biosynthesis protein B [Candidatus Desulfacyla euxinica]
MKEQFDPPIISVVGFSGAGKTTLLEKLIGVLSSRGYRVGSIKHDVHGFEFDKPGKDSWRHKHAGATTTLISSHHQIGMVMDVDHDHTPDELKVFFRNMDIIITEGYKQGNKPKLEIFRHDVHEAPLCRKDDHLIALISDVSIDLGVPQFSLDDTDGLADFLISSFDLDV